MVSLRIYGKGQGMALPVFLSAGMTLWIVLLYLSIGRLLLRSIKYSTDSLLLELLLQAGLGFGVIGNLIMLMNFSRVASSIGISVLMGILSVLCSIEWVVYLKRNRADVAALFRGGKIPPLLFLMLFIISLYFARTLLPPTGFDALMYHLASARLFLEHHGFYNIVFNPQSDFPMLSEMNYMIGLAAGNDSICQQIDLFTAVMACGVLVFFCIKCGVGKNGQILSSIIFLSMTVVIAAISNCDVDIAMAVWIALSVIMARKASESNSLGALIISAFFAGMAMQTKIFGVFVLPLLFFAGPFWKPKTWKTAFPVLLLPLLMGAPWYLKSYFNTGTILSIRRSVVEGQGLGLPMGIASESPLVHVLVNVFLRVAAAPWTFSLFPSQHQQDTLGPLFVAVIPFLLVTGRKGWTGFLIRMAGLYIAEVLFMEMVFIRAGASIRYVLVLPLLLIPVCLSVMEGLRNRRTAIYRILTLLIILQVGAGVLLLIKRYHKDWLALMTMKNRDQYYESILPQWPAIRYVNNLPDGSRVMTVFNYDNYLVDTPYVTAVCSDSAGLMKFINEESISHIYANDVLDTTSNGNAFPVIENKRVVFSRNGFYVYALD